MLDNKIYAKDNKMVEKWYKKQMESLFKERLLLNYNKFEEDIPFPNLRIRNMKTRWGVCNKKSKTITLNSNLMKYDVSKLDYVIIHELSHFIHLNHSKEFHEFLRKFVPNENKLRKEISKYNPIYQ